MKHKLLFTLLFFTSLVSAMEYTEADTALMQAVTAQDFAAVHAALKAGADVNLKHPKFFNSTPFSEAVADESDLIVNRLLCHPEVDIEAELKNKYRPLHMAVEHKRLKNVELLLLHGARLDHQNYEGNTPFHLPFWIKMEHINLKIARSLITCVPRAQTAHIKRCIVPLLCCFKRFQAGEGANVSLPRDIRKLLCQYCVQANLKAAVDFQLARVQPALEIKDNGNKIPFERASVPLRMWLELPDTNQLTQNLSSEAIRDYTEVTLLLKPENHALRRKAIRNALCDEFNLASIQLPSIHPSFFKKMPGTWDER